MTLEDFNEALGLPTMGQYDVGNLMRRQDFWKEIMLKENGGNPMDSRYVLHAPLRYAQIILANFVFASEESSYEVLERYIFRSIYEEYLVGLLTQYWAHYTRSLKQSGQ